MQLIESTVNQRGQLPLPAAHVVLDMRGISDDRVMEWLQVEVADLASEMKSHDVYHWRYLTDFLSFMRLNPLREDRESRARNNGYPDDEAMYGLMGQVHAAGPEQTIFYEDLRGSDDTENMPFDLFEQKIDELIQEINRVRNNRIAAVKDLNKAAIPGRSSRDSTVRVIFLTDIDHPESLTSAALYAERLKNYYRKLERPGHQPMLNTTVFCLGNSGEIGPPTALIQGLARKNSWDHLDSLILSENYREDAALISGTAQAYIAELLLYVLLIIPPLPVSSLVAGMDANPAPRTNGNGEQKKGQSLSLPVHTYVVGLAALEYSARWGRRWLNFGLAKDLIDILAQKSASSGKEKATLADIATNWFYDWRHRVQVAIPDDVPGDADALRGIYQARAVSKAAERPFALYQFSFHMGQSTIEDLKRYLAGLSETYVSASSEPALQDSLIHGSSQIMQVLREKEHGPVEERKVSKLGALQVESEQILGHTKFFRGATGAMPRARVQLEALAGTIASFQQEHRQNELNPLSMKDNMEHRKRNLEDTGNRLIENLKRHLTRWPFLTGTRLAKQVVAILTLLLIASLLISVITSGFAWLHHLIFERVPGILSFIDAPLLGVPVLVIIIVIAVALALLVELTLLRPSFFDDRKRRGLYIEIMFLVTLVAMGLFGLFISFSLANLVNLAGDVSSIQYLAWLSFMPGLGFVVFLFAILIVLIEIGYFFWWLAYLRQERLRIVHVLSSQHSQDIQDVINFIGDDLVIEIAQRAELCDGNGGLGPYYQRVTRLCRLLDTLARMTQDQQQLAAERLLFNQGDAQQGMSNKSDAVWLDLHMREEKLEREQLTDAYKEMRQQLLKEHPAIRELAEFMLRIEGTEEPSEIERHLRDKPDSVDSDSRRLQLFLTSLVAVAMRFAIDPLSIRNIGPITEEYQGMQEYASEEMPALNSLVKTLNKCVSQTMLQSSSRKDGEYGRADAGAFGNDIAANAVALWGQFFWLHKKPDLDQILSPEGILYHLERQLAEDYDPRAVMRRLLMHTVLFGRSLRVGQSVNVFLLLAPSQQSYHFRQGLKSLVLPRTIDFPDVERILLLGVKSYVAEPMLLPDPAVDKKEEIAPKTTQPLNGNTPPVDNAQADTGADGSSASLSFAVGNDPSASGIQANSQTPALDAQTVDALESDTSGSR